MDNKPKLDELNELREKVKDLESQLSETRIFPENVLPPIVIDLGKAKTKNIKALKRGRGNLMAEIAEATWELKNQLPENQKDTLLLPVVVIYRKRSKFGKTFFSI